MHTNFLFTGAFFFFSSPVLRDQQQAAARAPLEENVITKKTGWRRCGGLAKGLQHEEHEWNVCRRRLCSAWISESSVAADLEWEQSSGNSGSPTQRAASVWLKRPIKEHPWRVSLSNAGSTLLLYNMMLLHTEILRQSASGTKARWVFLAIKSHRKQEQWTEMNTNGKGKDGSCQPFLLEVSDYWRRKISRWLHVETSRHRRPWSSTCQGSIKGRECPSTKGCDISSGRLDDGVGWCYRCHGVGWQIVTQVCVTDY